MKHRKWYNRLPTRLGAVLLSGCLAMAVGPLWAATVGSVETWSDSDTSGWVDYDLVNETPVSSLTIENGAIRLVFRKQSTRMPPEQYVIMAGSDASGGRFTGDYLAGGVQAISFRLHCDHSVRVAVRFFNAETGRLWKYRVPIVTVDEWQTITVPVAPVALVSVNGTQSYSAFETDIQDVSWVGVEVLRDSSKDAQTCLVDDFTLIGPGEAFASWMAQFAQSGDRLPDGDLDGDGMANHGEWVAGTSAGDPSDTFKIGRAAVKPQNDEGTPWTVLHWKSHEGRTYSVWRTRDLQEPFVEISGDLDAHPPENAYTDGTYRAESPSFYRIQVEMDE